MYLLRAHFASNLARRIMKSLLAEYKHRWPLYKGRASLSIFTAAKKLLLLCCNKDVRAECHNL